MKQRILSILLALCLVLSLGPAQVLAAEPGDPVVREAATAQELATALEDSTVDLVRLTADIGISENLTVSRSVTLDLNDRVLRITGGLFTVTGRDVTLTLTDNAETKTAKKFKIDESGVWTLDETGDRTVTGGVITGGSVYVDPYGYFDLDIGFGSGILIDHGLATLIVNNVTINVPVKNQGGILAGSGTFNGAVINEDRLTGGTFNGPVDNHKGRAQRDNEISGGTFYGAVRNGGNYYDPDKGELALDGKSYGLISGGAFYGKVTNAFSGKITGGAFYGEVNNRERLEYSLFYLGTLAGGTFYGSLTGTTTIADGCCTVTYSYGTPDETYALQIVRKDDLAIRPDAPTRADYTFVGWELDGKAYDFTAPVTGDLTLTARWLEACICTESCYPGGNAACPRCGKDSRQCEFFLAPLDGTSYHSGDVIPVRWNLQSHIQSGDAMTAELLDETGSTVHTWGDSNPALGGRNVLLPDSIAPGRYILRCTLNRAADGAVDAVAQLESTILLNGAAILGKDRTVNYLEGMTVDLSELFLTAGLLPGEAVSYAVTGGADGGTLEGSTLHVVKPGIFTVTATVDRDPQSYPDYPQDRDTATLTVSGFSLRYELDGGTASGNPTYYSAATPDFTLHNPTKTGALFTGWSGTGLTGENNLTVTVEKGSTGDRRYTAHWTPCDHTGSTARPTCTTPAVCTVCGGTIAPTGHSPESGYQYNESTHWQACKNCAEQLGAAAHTYGDWTVLQAPTAGQPGLRERACTVCAYKQTQALAATGEFVDVVPGSYYEDAVIWAAGEGITTGMDETHFSPNAFCTRAQAVTFLWRAAGSPASQSTAMPFGDVPANAYYYEAVLWAVEAGITTGTDETHFSPDAFCTRAQAVAFLWRAVGSPAPQSTAMPFGDVPANAYYYEAVLWAAENGVTLGTSETAFSPDDGCTRGQIVTLIWRAGGSSES